MRSAVALAAVAGGLCWVAGAWVGPLAWLGGLLLAAAVLAAGAAMVSRTATWLRVLVAICFLALVASLVALLGDSLGREVILVGVGLLAAAAGGLALARRPAHDPRPRGAHAA